MTEIKTEKKEIILRNTTTGRYAGRRTIRVVTNPQDLSMDELRPAGVEGPLSETPPPTMGGVTAEQVEKNRRESKVVSHAEKSEPTGDRDED